MGGEAPRTYCFDIDGTLCSNTNGDYPSATPFVDRIAHINGLFGSGHTVVLFTARGSTTGRDWRELTEEQLSTWGVRYHELLMGKPHFDLLIDDRAVHSESYDWTLEKECASPTDAGLEFDGN